MKDRGVSLIQLICGQLSVALLMAVVPGLLILGLFGGLPWPTCVAGLLISAHFLLMSLEFASRGKWVPSGWRSGRSPRQASSRHDKHEADPD